MTAPAPRSRLRVFIAHPSALLTDSRPHGDGLIAWAYITGLAARGHELHVAAQRVAIDAPIPPGVHVHVLGDARRGSANDRLMYMARMRRLFARIDDTYRIDLVHQLNPVDVGLTLALPDLRVPLVLGPYWPDFWHRWWPGAPGRAAHWGKRAVRALQQSRSDVILLSTPAAREKLELPRRRGITVRELGPGIDPDRFTPGTEGASSETILFLAGVELYKGIYVLLDAFEQLLRRRPSARLVIAGSGGESERVTAQVRSRFPESAVALGGNVDRDWVGAAMRACAVYCLPSYGEPFGMSALEAMACARPIVGTGAGGLGYLLDDDGGVRVAPGDAGALADALERILSDPELGTRMGEHNRRLVEERYASRRVVARLEDIYREALDLMSTRDGAASPHGLGVRHGRRWWRAG